MEKGERERETVCEQSWSLRRGVEGCSCSSGNRCWSLNNPISFYCLDELVCWCEEHFMFLHLCIMPMAATFYGRHTDWKTSFCYLGFSGLLTSFFKQDTVLPFQFLMLLRHLCLVVQYPCFCSLFPVSFSHFLDLPPSLLYLLLPVQGLTFSPCFYHGILYSVLINMQSFRRR